MLVIGNDDTVKCLCNGDPREDLVVPVFVKSSVKEAFNEFSALRGVER